MILNNKMISSVLEKKYFDPERPYSIKELEVMRQQGFRRLRIGQVLVEHPECNHFYYAKINGKKEREMKESEGKNIGNCSVCWKIKHTPNKLKNKAYDMINAYGNFYTENESGKCVISYDSVDLEIDYYTWLYNEFNPPKPQSNAI